MPKPLHPGSRSVSPAGGELHDAPPLRSEFADDPEMTELVALFLTELPQRLEAVSAAWRSRDCLTLRRMAHQLRGAGSGYGFPDVTAAAADVEAALLTWRECPPEHELDSLRTRVEALIGVCRRAVPSRKA